MGRPGHRVLLRLKKLPYCWKDFSSGEFRKVHFGENVLPIWGNESPNVDPPPPSRIPNFSLLNFQLGDLSCHLGNVWVTVLPRLQTANQASRDLLDLLEDAEAAPSAPVRAPCAQACATPISIAVASGAVLVRILILTERGRGREPLVP